MRPPNYLAALLEQIAARGIQSGEIIPVEVVHDDDCPLILGHGPCGCGPEVIIGTESTLDAPIEAEHDTPAKPTDVEGSNAA